MRINKKSLKEVLLALGQGSAHALGFCLRTAVKAAIFSLWAAPVAWLTILGWAPIIDARIPGLEAALSPILSTPISALTLGRLFGPPLNLAYVAEYAFMLRFAYDAFWWISRR